MIVNIHAAKTHLSKLIQRAEAGEEVIIARNGAPAVKLTPVEPPSVATDAADAPSAPSWFGALKGKIWIAPGSEEPDEELTQLMEEGPIFPSDEPET
jgi:prevent-host-death family protein